MSTTKRVIAAVLGAFLMAAPAFAQVPSAPPPPYNVDLGALITNTLRAAGTVNSASQNNVANLGVVCTFQQTAISGTPSITFAIQGFDAATGTWNTLNTSSTITTSTTNIYTTWVYPGAVAADAPSNGTLKGISLPRTWRVQQVVAGTGDPRTTGKIGCNYLK